MPAHLAAVYRSFDSDGSLSFVKEAAGLSDRVMCGKPLKSSDSTLIQWYGEPPRAAAE